MDERAEPFFTLPRALLRAVAEVDAAYGWHSLPPLHEPRVIDLGADVGAFAVVASQVWPDARVLSYEGHPEGFAALVQNTHGLPVECTNVLDVAALGSSDVLRIDTQRSELSALALYPHLKDVSVLLVTTHDAQQTEQARAIAASAGLTSIGESIGSQGRSTLRFVRAEKLTRAAVDDPPAMPDRAGPSATMGALRPITPGDRPLYLYVSMISGSGKAWSDVEHALHVLGVLCQQRGVGLSLVRESMTGVDRARNVQTERCLELVRTAGPADRPTHMLHLDSDLVFNPDDIFRLMRSDLDVTAIAYPRKEIDWDRVIRAVKAGVPVAELARYSASFVFNFAGGNALRHPDVGTFIEVEEVGTGFLMIKVEALARYAAAYREEIEYVSDYEPRYALHHQFFHCERDPACLRETKLRDLKRAAFAFLRAASSNQSGEVERAGVLEAAIGWARTVGDPASLGRYLTEDYSFCRRWRMLGGKIYALMEAELGHIGKHVYRGTLERAVPIRDVPVSDVDE